jgi:hypothetical protein
LVSVQTDIAAVDIKVATVLVDTDSGGVIVDAISKDAAISEKNCGGKFEKVEIVPLARKTEFEVQGLVNKDESIKFNTFVGNETKNDENFSSLLNCEDSHPANQADVYDTNEGVLHCERSAEIVTNGDGIIDNVSKDDEAIGNEAQVNNPSDNIADSEKIVMRCGNGNVSPQISYINNHDPELTSKEKAASGRKRRDIDCDDEASGNCKITTSHNISTVAVDLKGIDVAHSVGESRLEASNGDAGSRDSSFHSKEGSMSMDGVNIADRSCLSHGEDSSCDDNAQPRVQDDDKSKLGVEEQKSKTDNEVKIDEAGSTLKDDARSDADTCRLNEDGYNNSTDDAKSEDIFILGTQAVVQEDVIDSLVNDTINATKNTDLNSQTLKNDCDDQIKENTCENDCGFGIEIGQSNVTMDIENTCDGIDSSYEEISNKKSILQIVPNQAQMEEFKDAATNNLLNDADIQVLPSHDEEALERNHPVEEEPSDIPQFIGGDSKQELRKSTRRFGRKKSKRLTDDGTTASSSSAPRVVHETSTRRSKGVTITIQRTEKDADSNVSESVDDDDDGGGSVISDSFREPDQKKRKRQIDDERSAFLSSTPRTRNDASMRKKKENTNSHKRTDEDEDSVRDELVEDVDGGERSEISVSKAFVQLEESSTRATSALVPSKGCNDAEDTNLALVVAKRSKDLSDLTPIPPKESNKESKRTITRSKKKNQDELSAQRIKSRRSIRGVAMKLPSITEPVNEKGVNNVADDNLSVQSIMSTRSTRSATRKSTYGTRSPKQKGKDIDDDDDDVSAQSKASKRSIRSVARKLPSITEPMKQKGGDNVAHDNLSVQSMISTKSTRSATRKLSCGTIGSKQKGKNIEDNDDVSAQSKASRRSTRSAARKLPSITEPMKLKDGDNVADDNLSVQSMISTRSTRSATRKLSCGTIGPKQKSKDIEDDDNMSKQSKASIRSTRSVTRNLSSVARSTKQKGKEMKDGDDKDTSSIQSRTSTRSTRYATRKRISIASLAKQKDDTDDDVSVHSIASRRTKRSATVKLSSSSVGTLKQKGNEINNDGDDELIQSLTSTRNTTRKLYGGTSGPKRKGEDVEQDDDTSIRSIISTRSTRSSTREIISGLIPRTLKDGEIETKKVTEDRNNLFSNWTVKMLQAELRERNIQFPAKLRKKELIEMLLPDNEGKKR